MKRTATRLLSIVLLGALALGCGDDDEDSPSQGNADSSTGTNGRDGGLGGIDATTGTTTPDATVGTLSDAQIAGILSTVNMGEIEAGNYASSKAQSPAAKDYASAMVSMHTAAQSDQTRTLQELGLTAADSPVSQMLKTTATTMLQQLMATPAGPSFDSAYISGQAEMHRTVLDLIDSQLLPQTDATQLKAIVQTARSMVAAHLEDARSLALALQRDGG